MISTLLDLGASSLEQKCLKHFRIVLKLLFADIFFAGRNNIFLLFLLNYYEVIFQQCDLLSNKILYEL